MSSILPKKGWVIRTTDGLVVLLDPETQLNEKGAMVCEITFTDRAFAERFLKAYQRDVSAAGYPTKFVLVEKGISPDQVTFTMTREEVEKKIEEEMQHVGR